MTQLPIAVALAVEAVADLADPVGGLQYPAGHDRVESGGDLTRLQDGVGAPVAPVEEADPVDAV